MNKRQALSQIKQNEAILQIVSSRSDAIISNLAIMQRYCDSTQDVLEAMMRRMAQSLVALNWHSKLFQPANKGSKTIWLLIAPDYSGADRSVVSYRDLFFEKAIGLINKQTDQVICIGADAVDLAVTQGYKIAYSDSADFFAIARIEELSGFLSRMFVDAAIDTDFDKSAMLYLGPQQSVRHGLLPFEDYDGALDVVQKATKKPLLVYPDAGRFVLDGLACFVTMAIAVALGKAGVFAQTARYQGFQQTKERVNAEQRRLRSNIAAIDSLQQQDEQNSLGAQRRAMGQ